jgi:Signal transduction histidine kinase
MAGNGATWNEDQLVPVTRHGRREDVWWTYSFGPIDFEGKVGGVLVVCRDVTSEHMAKEALNLINEELKHRVKNTLTVLGAVATQTFATYRAKPISKSIKDDLLRSDERTTYLPQQIGLQRPSKR